MILTLLGSVNTMVKREWNYHHLFLSYISEKEDMFWSKSGGTPLKNDNLGLKMKILKFLRIQPNHKAISLWRFKLKNLIVSKPKMRRNDARCHCQCFLFIFDLSDNIRNCSKEFGEQGQIIFHAFIMHIHINKPDASNRNRFIEWQSGSFDEFEEFSE